MGSDDAEEEVATLGVAADKVDKTTETRLSKPERASKPRLADAPDFGPRYRVLGVLGRGGMGEVYRAFDADLREDVALKVVRTDQAELDAHGRFRREIALARKVTDPNVLRVYDLGDYQGLRYLSMEFVDGDSLAAVLRKEKLELSRALAIFRQVCKGLVAAHAQGVVHRDLKPQNVLVDKQDRVRVADFGLARSIGDSGLTASGAILGSPAYMSPEQVKGDPADERSDIYSLGVMLYQLVTGEAPFKADSPHALMEMRLHKKPRPLHELVPDAPAYLEAIVAHCLEVEPSDRYRSVTALLDDLDASRAPSTPAVSTVTHSRTDVIARRAPRWPFVVGAGVLAAAAIAYVAWPRSDQQRVEPPHAPAVAATGSAAPAVVPQTKPIPVLVLAIENRAGDATFDSSLEFVLEQALRRSRILDPIVGVRMQQVAADLGPSLPTDELGAKLAERDQTRVLVMRGSVTAQGTSFTLAFTTTDAQTKNVVLASNVQVTIDNVIAETARLGSELRRTMGEKVADKEVTESGLSPSLEAVHEYALGLSAHRSANEERSLTHFLRAVELDPKFARAHLMTAGAYTNMKRPVEAQQAYKMALGSLDRMSDRDRLKFLGDYHMRVTFETDRSIAAYEELLATWPDDYAAANNLVNALAKRHQLAKAIEVSRQTAKRHPRTPIVRENHPGIEIQAGYYEEAITAAKAVLAEFPKPYAGLHLYLAIAQTFVTPEQAAASYARLLEIDKEIGPAAIADIALAEGRLADAAKAIRDGLAIDGTTMSSLVELKHVMEAERLLRRGDKAGARAAAAKVTSDDDLRFLAALALVEAGDEKKAMMTAKQLAGSLGSDPRAYAKLIEAESLRRRGKAREAFILAGEALALSDLWHGHFLLGLAALDAGQIADAFTELQICHKRRGEIALSINDIPGMRYAVPATYYLARAQQALGSADAAATYRTFLATQPKADPTDPLVVDTNARLASLK